MREPRASLRARLLAATLRRWIKPRSAAPPDPEASRAFVNRWAMPAGRGVSVRAAQVGGVPGEWLATGSAGPTLLYVHGGAFTVCSPATHRPITGAFARRGFRVFAPDYRLAPEHRFPAALDDVLAAYRGLVASGTDPASIALGGDSAGGGLVLSCLVRLRDLRLPRPAAATLFSPWTDLAATGPSLRENARADPLFFPRQIRAVARLYLGDADPKNPLASPLYADPRGLPPILVHAGTDEILLDDSRRLVDAIRAGGGDAVLRTWPTVPHGWQIFGGLLPEARQSLDDAAAFLRARLPRTGPPGRGDAEMAAHLLRGLGSSRRVR